MTISKIYTLQMLVDNMNFNFEISKTTCKILCYIYILNWVLSEDRTLVSYFNLILQFLVSIHAFFFLNNNNNNKKP